MTVDMLHGVGRAFDVPGLRHAGDLEAFGESANASDIDLHDVHRIVQQEVPNAELGVFVLTGTQRNVRPPLEAREAWNVVREYRFLEQEDVEIPNRVREFDRSSGIPAVVRV